MTFSNSAEAFSYYQNMPESIIEARAEAIKSDVQANADADLSSYRIELEALKAVRESRSKHERIEQRGQLRHVGGTEDKHEDVFSTPEYRSAFFAKVMGHTLTDEQRSILTSDEVLRRASEFNSSDNSVAVLPTETLNEVIRRARDHGGIIAEARAFHMPTGIAIPVAGPGSKAQWHEEGATVETEKLATTTIKFDGYELLRIFSVSEKVGRMSIPAFESEIINELGESITEAIAEALVTGDGEGKGEGIETIEWTEGENLLTVDNFSWRDLLKLLGMLRRGYAQKAKLAMNNRTLFDYVFSAFSDDNVPVFLSNLQDSGSMRLVGKQIVIDDYLSDGEIIFGDWSKIAYNLPEGIAIERSREAGFTSGQTMFRGLAIADSKVILPEAFVKLQIEG